MEDTGLQKFTGCLDCVRKCQFNAPIARPDVVEQSTVKKFACNISDEGLSLERLRADIKKYHAKWEKTGNKFTSYTCPYCFKQIKVPQPTRKMAGVKGYWDGKTQCYECGGFVEVKVWPGGRVEVNS
jgi:hypothetical protein